MAVTVKIPTPLRGLTGEQDTYAADPSDLRGVVTALEGAFPGMQERLLDDGGDLRGRVEERCVAVQRVQHQRRRGAGDHDGDSQGHAAGQGRIRERCGSIRAGGRA